MKQPFYGYSVLMSAAAFALCAGAGAAEYKVDQAHSSVGFSVKHLVSKVPGRFGEYEGTIQFDEKSPEKSKVEFSVATKSINTDNADRDKHLRSEDFFHVEKFPKMTFVGKKIKSKGDGKYDLEGDLTIRGKTKPVTFKVEYLGKGTDPWGNDKVGFSAGATIDRNDFDIKWNKPAKTLSGIAGKVGDKTVGDNVDISVEIEANQQKEAAKK